MLRDVRCLVHSYLNIPPAHSPSEGYSWDKDLKESMGSMFKELTFISTWEDRTTETESIGI